MTYLSKSPSNSEGYVCQDHSEKWRLNNLWFGMCLFSSLFGGVQVNILSYQCFMSSLLLHFSFYEEKTHYMPHLLRCLKKQLKLDTFLSFCFFFFSSYILCYFFIWVSFKFFASFSAFLCGTSSLELYSHSWHPPLLQK